MADLKQLLAEFSAEFDSGADPDPGRYLAQVEGAERTQLADLIDAYLDHAPTQPWDHEAYARSPAKQAVDRVYESIEGVSGTWPELLPRLRRRARLKRQTLTARLAESLGFPGEQQRVAAYYHRMEHGLLPAAGVSDKVLGALAELVNTSRESLRAAGERAGGLEGPADAASFARTARPDPSFAGQALRVEDADAAEGEPQGPPPGAASGHDPDDLDRLFLGPLD